MLFFTISNEKITGKGEDAPPSLLIDEYNATGLLCVCDGLGGAGSTPYQIGREQYSGAFLAARLAMQVTEQVFAENSDNVKQFTERLPVALQATFSLKINQLDHNRSKLKSKLIKRLPTTLAGVAFSMEAGATMRENTYHLDVFGAGDSRVYVLTGAGLQQISVDDLVVSQDALENLLEDSPISNIINADDEISLRFLKYRFQEPILLIAATDGCFNYFATPFHFEYYVLEALFHPKTCTVLQWQQRLEKHLAAVASDDISLSLLTLGYGEDLMNVKIALLDRFVKLRNNFMMPFVQANFATEQEKNDLREKLWQKYKENYYPKTAESKSGEPYE